MSTVRINTSDTAWIGRHGLNEPVAYGTDIKGVMYFQVEVEVTQVERKTFAGANMIRFDLPSVPLDHPGTGAMYPATYLVND